MVEQFLDAHAPKLALLAGGAAAFGAGVVEQHRLAVHIRTDEGHGVVRLGVGPAPGEEDQVAGLGLREM